MEPNIDKPLNISRFNYINNSLININDKPNYNSIDTKSIFHFLKYKNNIISKDKNDK